MKVATLLFVVVLMISSNSLSYSYMNVQRSMITMDLERCIEPQCSVKTNTESNNLIKKKMKKGRYVLKHEL
jgi:hypothetical protein